MKTVLATIVLSFVLLAAPQASFAGEAAGYKAVIQVSENDPAKWNLALNNARNAQQELGKDNVQLQIVAYGPGINMLKLESEVGDRLAEAKENGVVIIACGNTMKGQKLAPSDMHPAAKIVPAGVVEIMKLQREGYAYIRP
jgi:hypothetical protein